MFFHQKGKIDDNYLKNFQIWIFEDSNDEKFFQIFLNFLVNLQINDVINFD